ncbi:MAG: hypothetical protein RIE59_23655 [Imperialibacter sp.]
MSSHRASRFSRMGLHRHPSDITLRPGPFRACRRCWHGHYLPITTYFCLFLPVVLPRFTNPAADGSLPACHPRRTGACHRSLNSGLPSSVSPLLTLHSLTTYHLLLTISPNLNFFYQLGG